MSRFRVFFIFLSLSLLGGCGAGEFFIKRAINNLQDDVADEFKGYADFDKSQEQKIDEVAQQIDIWVRRERLPVLYRELDKMAHDIEQNSQISRTTWASTVLLLEQPMNLATHDSVVKNIANIAYGMNEEQAEQAIKKFKKDYRKTRKDQKKVTLEKQNKRLAKGIKIVFSELGISRTKAQMAQTKAMLALRKSHIELDHRATERNQKAFVELIRNRRTEQPDYIVQFAQAWETAELGAKHEAPELWEHNAQIVFEVLNYLLSNLEQEQQKIAAKKIRGYADLFKKLSIET